MTKLSPLPKTWIFDLDGTLVQHNGHLNGGDVLLEGVADFFCTLCSADKVIIVTGRDPVYAAQTKDFLRNNGIRFDDIIFGCPLGERILINDAKPSGLLTAHAVNVQRDGRLDLDFEIDKDL